jgi:hypothetical protein
MRVKLTVGMAGADISLSPGDVHEFPDDEAQRFIDAGYAVAEEPAEPVAAKAPVKAAAPKAKKSA